jgi:ribosome-binding factor A
MAKYRGGRINEEVKKSVSNIIQNEIKDPRINTLISVTKVDVTNDLKYAKVFVSILGKEEEKKLTMEVLKKSAGFIRRELAHEVKLRVTPEVSIHLDNSIEEGMHIDALIEKIKENNKDDNE